MNDSNNKRNTARIIKIIVCAVISVIFVLFFLWPQKMCYKDGGTVEYSPFIPTYKIIRWHAGYIYHNENGEEVLDEDGLPATGYLIGTTVYLFPKSIISTSEIQKIEEEKGNIKFSWN